MSLDLWKWKTKDGKPLEPRVYVIDGKRKTQAELVSEVLGAFETGYNPILLNMATGTGKTYIGLAAAFNYAWDDIMNKGKPVLVIVPFKLLQRSLEDQLRNVVYEGTPGFNIYTMFGRSEYTCLINRQSAAACLGTNCPLYIPPIRSNRDPSKYVKLFEWNGWRVHGLHRQALLTDLQVDTQVKNTLLGLDREVLVCPYYEQYEALDQARSCSDQARFKIIKIIILNYFKYIRERELGRIKPEDFAFLVLDEIETLSDMFAPRQLDMDMLYVLRHEIERLSEAVDNEHKREVLVELHEIVNEAIRLARSPDLDPDQLLLLLRDIKRKVIEEDWLEDTPVYNVVMETIPIDTRVPLGDHLVVKQSNAILVGVRRLAVLEEMFTVPTLMMTATPSLYALKAGGVRVDDIKVIEGPMTSPGHVVILPLEQARLLRGMFKGPNDHRNDTLFRYLCSEVFNQIKKVKQALGSEEVSIVGMAFAKHYIKRCEDLVWTQNFYVDEAGRSLDAVYGRLKKGDAVISTRIERGVNLPRKVNIIFIPKFPRPPKNSPEVAFYSKLARAMFFNSFMLNKIHKKQFLLSPEDFMEEKAYTRLYQMISRSLRGPDYVAILVSTDLEVYAGIADLALAGFIDIDNVYALKIVKDTMEVVKVDKDELQVLSLIKASPNEPTARGEWTKLIGKWIGKDPYADLLEFLASIKLKAQQEGGGDSPHSIEAEVDKENQGG
jgi:hypothetical protein